MKIRHMALLFLLAIASSAFAAEQYDYPFADPSSPLFSARRRSTGLKLPAKIPVTEMALTLYEDRAIPQIFWYQDMLRSPWRTRRGNHRSSLLSRGTGVDYNGATMLLLQKIFYMAGFHVACLSSSTCPNFIITASSTMVPGDLSANSADLYRVMQRAWDKMKSKISVSDFLSHRVQPGRGTGGIHSTAEQR